MPGSGPTFSIAVLSDTHGLLRPEVLEACRGVDAILHAGDVGDPAILQRLGELAHVTAIRGNIATSGPCSLLPATEMVEFGPVTVYMVHSVHDLDINPVAAGVDVLVSGHSHKPGEHRRDGVLYLNPGSVGPRRFKLPVNMAFLTVHGRDITVTQKDLGLWTGQKFVPQEFGRRATEAAIPNR